MYKFSLIAAAISLMLAMPAVADDEMQRQMDAQQRAMLQMQNQVDTLQQNIASLQGSIDELKYNLSQVQSQVVKLQQAQSAAAQNTAAAQPNASDAGNAAPAADKSPAKSAAASNLAAADKNAEAAYNQAYAFIVKNDLAKASAAFSQYVAAYPNNSLTPNAWYWLGQAQYKQGQLKDAKVSFLNAARFNSSNKRPDAIYKLGLITKAGGDTAKANKYFELVIKNYPNDAAAVMAKRELGN